MIPIEPTLVIRKPFGGLDESTDAPLARPAPPDSQEQVTKRPALGTKHEKKPPARALKQKRDDSLDLEALIRDDSHMKNEENADDSISRLINIIDTPQQSIPQLQPTIATSKKPATSKTKKQAADPILELKDELDAKAPNTAKRVASQRHLQVPQKRGYQKFS